MNALIVFAHPETNSFNAALRDTALATLRAGGHEVTVSDLYRMNFKTAADSADFRKQENVFAEDIQAEIEKLDRADLVIFNFPLWWFSMPAILKGWVDRVFAYGFAYGAGKGTYNSGALSGKKAMLTFTTGNPENSFGPGSPHGDMKTILYHIHHGMFYYVGMEVLEPFIAWNPGRTTEEERKKYLENYSKRLEAVFSKEARGMNG